ncbi:MAG: hypothetical protein V7K54_24595 [Nostoc sp.]
MPHNSCSSNFSSDRLQIVTSNSDRSLFSLPLRPTLREATSCLCVLCGSILMLIDKVRK